MHNFKEDLNKSNEIPKKEWENLFKKLFRNDLKNVVWLDTDKTSQLTLGLDCCIETPKGRRHSIEYKVRDNQWYKHGDVLLEITHHIYTDETRKKKIGDSIPGWLYKSTADFIVYTIANRDYDKLIEAYGFSLSPFKDRIFASELDILDKKWSNTKYEDGKFQLTLNRVAPKSFIESHADKFYYYVDDEVNTCQSTL